MMPRDIGLLLLSSPRTSTVLRCELQNTLYLGNLKMRDLMIDSCACSHSLARYGSNIT